ncbi:MAG: MarR family transcriptional regulator [Planctomycetes bacterium]|nr:MarR family transcriptional regulator [Planctomycetota bacterium]MCW8135790.1 MarR family transcriptional regulator [Planctomycetota bacterium]
MDETYIQRSRAVARMVFTANQLFRAVNATVRRFELTESQYNALRILRGAEKRGESLTQAELAERLIASRANTTWILDKLEERRLIRRKGHSDRRKNLVEITTAGQRLLTRIDPEFEKLLNRVLEQVGDDELSQLMRTIDRFKFD